MDIEIKPIYSILWEDVITLFYIFQLFSLTVWFVDGYYLYGTAICVMLSVSLFGEIHTIYTNLKQLRKMAHYECRITVKRVNTEGHTEWKEISSSELVPGDVFVLPEGKKLPCDAIMLKGESVINEAMLTGN